MQLFEERGVQILGVSFDTVEENRAFAEKYDFNFPLLSDTAREAGLAYGACDDRDAKHAKRISYLVGPDGRVEKAYPDVDPKTHPDTVLAELEA